MPSPSFSEFDPVGKDAWEKQAAKELKEKFSSAIGWEIGSGLRLGSYYTQEDLNVEKAADMQQCQKKVPGWLNLPAICFSEPSQTNLRFKNALQNGADAILADLGSFSLAKCEFPKLLHGIRLSDTPVFFQTPENPVELFSQISKHAGYYLKGGIAFDPIAHWMRHGDSFGTHLAGIVSVLNQTRNMREFRPFMVETHLYHNNGADPVQELAFTLASAVTYLDLLTETGIPPLTAFNRILFSVSIGTQYLTEIAKLRALRFLLQKISRAYALPDELCIPFIHAKTSSFYSTTASPYTNMVRATAEAMSAVSGGCNALTVSGYDQQAGKQDDFSGRIARNVSSILNYESGLGTVADPASGSYMLDSISISLAEVAWDLFLDMEEKGGLVACFKAGFIQEALKNSLDKKIGLLANGRVMIGVNKFIEPEKLAVSHSEIAPAGPALLYDKNLAECLKTSLASL